MKAFTSIFFHSYTQWLIKSKYNITQPFCLRVSQKIFFFPTYNKHIKDDN